MPEVRASASLRRRLLVVALTPEPESATWVGGLSA